MFMTERGDPRAVWDVVYGCNPDTDELQVELAFKERGDNPPELGGLLGVRPFNGMYDFRWKGPGTSGMLRAVDFFFLSFRDAYAAS